MPPGTPRLNISVSVTILITDAIIVANALVKRNVKVLVGSALWFTYFLNFLSF